MQQNMIWGLDWILRFLIAAQLEQNYSQQDISIPVFLQKTPLRGFTAPFLGFPRSPTLLALSLEPSRVPWCPSQQGGDTGAAAALTVPLKEPSVKLFLRIKRAFTAFIFHMSHTIKDLEVPTPRGNKITVSKKYKLVEREIILNI